MRELFGKLREIIVGGNDAVLVTVVSSDGSVPRGSGAMMLVDREGRRTGTTGGGEVEFRAEQIALNVLQEKKSRTESFSLYHTEQEQAGTSGASINRTDSICGGDQELFFKYFAAGSEETLSFCEELDKMYEGSRPCWMIMELTPKDGGAFILFGDKPEAGEMNAEKADPAVVSELGAASRIAESGGRRYYIQRLVSPGKVYIFGGGHVSQQLVPVLARCDFRCIVLEDRPEFAEPDLFEGVYRTQVADMDRLGPVADELTEDDYVCIMTRGHRNDYRVVYEMLKSRACYIGVIGSRKKVAALREHLIADGFGEKDLERLTMPIGIEICSETPAEIAVSIAAQLIKVRAVRSGSRKLNHLSEGDRQ